MLTSSVCTIRTEFKLYTECYMCIINIFIFQYKDLNRIKSDCKQFK